MVGFPPLVELTRNDPFAENQLTKFSARDAGDFSDAAGEQEMAPKCGSLPRDAGDLVGLLSGSFRVRSWG